MLMREEERAVVLKRKAYQVLPHTSPSMAIVGLSVRLRWIEASA